MPEPQTDQERPRPARFADDPRFREVLGDDEVIALDPKDRTTIRNRSEWKITIGQPVKPLRIPRLEHLPTGHRFEIFTRAMAPGLAPGEFPAWAVSEPKGLDPFNDCVSVWIEPRH